MKKFLGILFGLMLAAALMLSVCAAEPVAAGTVMTITGNTAQYGGAIYCDDLDDAHIYIKGGTITGNTATEDGDYICPARNAY